MLKKTKSIFILFFTFLKITSGMTTEVDCDEGFKIQNTLAKQFLVQEDETPIRPILPEAIWVSILSLLPNKDFITMGSVSSFFKKITTKDDYLDSRLEKHIFSCLLNEALITVSQANWEWKKDQGQSGFCFDESQENFILPLILSIIKHVYIQPLNVTANSIKDILLDLKGQARVKPRHFECSFEFKNGAKSSLFLIKNTDSPREEIEAIVQNISKKRLV